MPDAHPHWGLLLLASALGTLAGTIPMDHEVFPRISFQALLRQVASIWVMRFLVWAALLAAIAAMPQEVCLETLFIAAAVLAMCIFWARDGWIRIGRMLRRIVPASERLQRVVIATAARMNVRVSEICVIRISFAQAYAFPASRRLLFSERLVELLSDEEIAAVCAHELAHLTESRSQHYSRYVVWLTFLPWIFFNPVIHALGMPGFLALTLGSLVAPFDHRIISHKLEVRADQIARAQEPDSGTYAHAWPSFMKMGCYRR
jgi:Zn-dependent protease with chaperone function